MPFAPLYTRRWQRHLVDLPVRILPRNGISQTALPGRLSEISEGGMSLYVGIHLEPGDLMEVEFETPYRARVSGIVRSRVGYCFGLEFLTPLLAGDRSAESQQAVSSSHALSVRKAASSAILHQEPERPQPRAEIEVLQQWFAVPSFVRGEKAAQDETKLDRVLHNIAARALQATGATGVAIGLGRQGAMVCRATAGLPIPDVGVKINTESGLAAAAIRRQMSQWCSDTESDPRVDLELCRQLRVRSIMVVPVRARDAVIGIFAIFSVNPDAFSLSDLMKVKDLAHRAAEAIETAFGSVAPPQAIAPAIATLGNSAGKELVGFRSKCADRVEPWNYAAKIRHRIFRYWRRRPSH
jgi:putative methionine-R-sulfoxide reductase with GAF domain